MDIVFYFALTVLDFMGGYSFPGASPQAEESRAFSPAGQSFALS